MRVGLHTLDVREEECSWNGYVLTRAFLGHAPMY